MEYLLPVVHCPRFYAAIYAFARGKGFQIIMNSPIPPRDYMKHLLFESLLKCYPLLEPLETIGNHDS